jgi:sodium/potassium-transporting ATPase subunit alpha
MHWYARHPLYFWFWGGRRCGEPAIVDLDQADCALVYGQQHRLRSYRKTHKHTFNCKNPLQKEVLRFVFIIVALMVLMNINVTGVWAGYIRQNHPDFMPVNLLIVNIVSVAIAFVPEGLPIALTASLTIVANIMRKNNILCKSLKTVETLGAISVLLSDKTGTLTKNQMVVTDCLIGFSALTADEAQLHAVNEAPESTWSSAALNQLRVVSAVCNAGEFDPLTLNLPLAKRRIIGDATDQAVLRFSESLAPVTKSRDL